MAFAAGSSPPRAVAVDDFVWGYTGITFDVIDVLRVVTQKFVAVLQNADELVSRAPFVELW